MTSCKYCVRLNQREKEEYRRVKRTRRKRGRRRRVAVALGARVGRRVGRQAAGRGGVGVGADRHVVEHLGAAGPGARGLLGAGDGLHAVGGGQRRHRGGGGQEKDRKGERARHTCVFLASWACDRTG